MIMGFLASLALAYEPDYNEYNPFTNQPDATLSSSTVIDMGSQTYVPYNDPLYDVDLGSNTIEAYRYYFETSNEDSDRNSFFTFNGSTVALYVNSSLMQTWYAASGGNLLTEASEFILTEAGENIQWE